VHTVKESENVTKVAKAMARNKIGSVIVVDKKHKPLGIITEKDIVHRVVSKGLHPNKVSAGKIMSKPLRTIEPTLDVKEAAKRMKQLKRKRFAVMEAGKLVGIVTQTDIVSITPALIDVMEEKSKIRPLQEPRETGALAGYCDNCGSWSDDLKSRDGAFLCVDCTSDLEEKED
jgi:signal-transduction protein with cAMP-binding, CBS, and nucleotidyltransferase domain